MGKTTNILDLNNRLEKVEKGNVAQNSYTSLKNKPKINGNLLTGDKTGAQLGLAEAQDIGDLNALTTTDKSSVVGAINELNSGLTNVTALAHQDYIDVYQNGVTVHIYLRSSSTPTPSDSNILLRGLPIPKGATTIYAIMSYQGSTSRNIGLLKVNQLGQILIEGLDDSALKGVSYLVGELVYLIN